MITTNTIDINICSRHSILTFQDFGVGVGTLEPVEEGVAELGQRPELFLRVDDERVSGDDPVVVGVHHRDEPEVKK